MQVFEITAKQTWSDYVHAGRTISSWNTRSEIRIDSKPWFILPANASCNAKCLASQNEKQGVPIMIASQNFALHSQEV